jgi:hypothetical protein
MQSKYNSPNSVSKRQTVYIDVNDPRLKNGNYAQTLARQGAEVVIVDLKAQNARALSLDSQIAIKSPDTNSSNSDSKGLLNFYQAANILKASNTVTPPSAIVWDTVNTKWVGSTLHLAWTWNAADQINAYAQFVVLTFSNGVLNKSITVSSSQIFYDLTLAENRTLFGLPVTSGLTVTAVVQDAFGNTSTQPTVPFALPLYVMDLPTPAITVVAVKNGYSVAYTTPTQSDFTQIEIQEVVSSAGSDPGNGYADVYTGTINPAIVITPDTQIRWVRARFTDNTGSYTGYSTAYRVTPQSPVSVNYVVPSEVAITSSSWLGNNVVINYRLPTTNAGVRFIVTLTAPNASNGYFYVYPDGTTNLDQVATITDAQLLGQFGQYYSSFSGLFQSASNVDARSNGVSFAVGTRANPLATITPNPSVSAIIDGYSTSVSNETAQVQHVEVYEYFLDPKTMLASMSTLIDSMDANYVSGGASGANTIVLNNWKDNMAMPIVNPNNLYGMAITGNGVPPNTYITSITIGPSSNYTVHLNNNLISQASGSYHMPSLVASGSSPLIRYTTNFVQVWVVVVYYDEFNNNSLFSTPITVTPINSTTSLINSAIQVSPSGSIYLGSSNTSVPNVIIGTTSGEAGIFVWGPNDGTSTTSGTPSTQIIGAAGSPYTLVTTNAHIGDWSITSSHIQNDLSNGTYSSGYTGLSGSNPQYAIWAGATSSDNSDGSAKFSVSPSGSVIARNMQIAGGSLDIGSSSYTYLGTGTTSSTTLTVSSTTNLVSGMYVVGNGIANGTKISSVGSGNVVLTSAPISNITNVSLNFISQNGAHITANGSLYATSANISGTITATGGSFSGNVQLASGITGGASIYSGTLNNSGNLTSAGFILNSSGITFNNGTTNVTTIDASTGTFTTALANIGGWNINSSTIYKTAATGTVTLDSANSLFTTKNAAGTYYSSLSVPLVGSDSNTYVMWAGATANTAAAVPNANFKVGVDGTLYATGAIFNGTALSTSLTGISTTASNAASAASSAQTTAQNAATVAANAQQTASNKITIGGAAADITSNNTKITGGNISTGAIKSTTYTPPITGSIYSQSGMSIVLDGQGSIISPNFVLDSSGNVYVKGTIASGSTISGASFYIDGYNYWNYSNGSPGGNNFNAGNGTTNFNVDGNAGSIKIQTTSPNAGFYTGSDGLPHSQSGNQLIKIDSTGMHINGMQVYGNDYRVYDYYSTGSYFNHQQNVISGAPFTRTMIYAPMSSGDNDGPDGYNVGAGDIATGFAIYYGKTSTGTPNGGTGLIGDLFIEV